MGKYIKIWTLGRFSTINTYKCITSKYKNLSPLFWRKLLYWYFLLFWYLSFDLCALPIYFMNKLYFRLNYTISYIWLPISYIFIFPIVHHYPEQGQPGWFSIKVMFLLVPKNLLCGRSCVPSNHCKHERYIRRLAPCYP